MTSIIRRPRIHVIAAPLVGTRRRVTNPFAEHERICRIAPLVVADYLRNTLKPAIREKYNIGNKVIGEILESGTTPEQRRDVLLRRNAATQKRTAKRCKERRANALSDSRAADACRGRAAAEFQEGNP